jgi:hypothetical protein
MGRIAERRRTAIFIYTNGIGTERHWMPKRSDCPYPEVFYSEIHNAVTFSCFAAFALRKGVISFLGVGSL